jgi:hypothetical protein
MKSWLIAGAGAAAILSAAPAAADVTFNKNVMPILQRKCQACHRPGEIGPMPLMTFRVDRNVDPRTVIEAGGFRDVGAQ